MLHFTQKVASAVFLGIAAVAPAHAQFNPYPNYNPYNPYTNAYVNPYGSYYSGVSQVIDSQGRLMLNTQQAYSMQEEVKRSKIDTRRKNFDELRYERANTPTVEEERARSRQQELQRSRNDPPLPEIWSGKALNDLLLNLQTTQGAGAYAPTVMLDPNMLRHINVYTGQTNGSAGLLRNGQKLRWPLALQESGFDAERKRIDALVPVVVRQARDDEIQGATVKDLSAAVSQMTDNLKEKVSEISTTDYLAARRYVTQLYDAVQVLKTPDAANYFNNKWTAKGNSVAELVKNMTDQGLKFAPATSGDEAYYTALHRALANYDTALSQRVARR